MNDVYLHVGPVKTGSTYLQSTMWNSRDVLREQGVLLPAAHPNEFFLAANDVQGGQFVLVDMPEADGAWANVAARARSWPRRALITCELLGFCEPGHVQRIVDSLAAAAAPSRFPPPDERSSRARHAGHRSDRLPRARRAQ